MPQVYLTSSWVTDAPIETVKEKLKGFIFHSGMRVTSINPGEIILEQGSQFATRMVGGWLVDLKDLPKRAKIQLAPTEDGKTKIDAAIKEAIGIGFVDPLFANRYNDYFRQWMGSLRILLPPMPTESTPAPKERSCPSCQGKNRPGAQFCVHCGAKLE
jgi:hypothetical protein